MIWYTISSILWALGGLVVGFFLGRSGQSSSAVNRTGGAELSSEQPGDGTVVVEATVHRFRESLTFDRIVGWLVILLAVLSVLTVSYTVSRQQQVVTCQADYNVAFVAALKERSEAAVTDRQAQRALFSGVVQAKDPVSVRKLIDDYLAALDAADDRRDEHPLPERPIC